jgi:uncharacterized coiled-coil protein SlyX
MNPLIQLKTTPPLLIMLTLLCFTLLPKAQAVSPPPPGGYPNFTTAAGDHALQALTLGVGNTAIGTFSLFSVTTGSFNTAVGAGSLDLNTGDSNTATGAAALLFNTAGTENTATGTAALELNSTGGFNTANGAFALFSNTQGETNTATGLQALFNNTIGFDNTANGANALISNTEGIDNTATGDLALRNNITGDGNTAIGHNALANSTSGDLNTALGANAGNGVTTASNVICIRAAGTDVSDSCFIGNIYSNAQPIVGTDPDSVTITSGGRLGRGNVSSRRYKHDIKPMEKASEVLYALKPVSFRYHKEYDATQTLAFGLIAEEVAEVYPDLVGRNPEGQPESVRYEQINAMLLNEFLKEHSKVQEQEATISQLKSTLAKKETIDAHQQKQIEALTAGLQKVSAQLELNKPAPQTAQNTD